MARAIVGLIVTCALSATLAGAASAAAPAPPFTQCPPVGADTSCALLIHIDSSGGVGVFGDPSQGPYDSVEDTMVGVQNDSGTSIASIPLSSTTGKALFGFDGDGLCTFLADPGCPFGATGYEGPGVSFTNISADFTAGTVNFSPPIAPGAHAYFSLEEALATVPPFDVDPGPPVLANLHMVSLGDSYSSGEGTFNYDNNKQAQKCHRGPDAWPRVIQHRALNITTIKHVACSGAKTPDLFEDFKANPPQVPLTADPNVQLVTLTIGGNDIGFVDILRSCYVTFSSCAKVPESPSFSNHLNALRRTLAQNVYPAIRAAYPNALIVHAGYPRLTPKPGITPVSCGWLSKPEQQAASDMAAMLNNTIQNAVADYAQTDPNTVFAPVLDALNGHELCTRDSWMVPINAELGDAAGNGSSERGHPTSAGQVAYAQAVADDIGVSLPTF